MFNVNLYGTDKKVDVNEVYKNEIAITCDYKYLKYKIKDKSYLMNVPLCFDTETSHNHNDDTPKAWIYQWCLSIGNDFYVGRKPSEFCDFLVHILDYFKCDSTHKIVIYVHNLSYDFCYIIDWLKDMFGIPKILALKPHKILTVEFEKFIFRCSYLLSNRSLDAWGEYMRTDIKKAKGYVDYELVRYQDTELSTMDWIYMVSDVACMNECLTKMLALDNDTVVTIPLTNTGYVRRTARKKFKSDKKNRELFNNCKLNYETYMLCRSEFRGAISGGNILLNGKVITGDIAHYDFKSHYPSQLQLAYFPISKFVKYYSDKSNIKMDFDELLDLCKNKCVLMSLVFQNLKLKNHVTCPYETLDRCIKGKIGNCEYKAINGKLVYFKGYTRLILNELDLKWILKQYYIDSVYIETVYIADRGHIPVWLHDTIHEFFSIKESTPKGIQYDKSKNNLNGIYGMCATDIVRNEYIYNFDNGEWNMKVKRQKDFVEDALNKYYNSRNSFMFYQFGCYCTAHARDKLMHIIADVIGYENYIYCDTDSEFFLKNDNAIKNINDYNNKAVELSKKLNLGVNNLSGGISYYGTFNDEEENIIQFKFLHSKCYAYVTNDNKLHATIAGVSKKVITSFDNETNKAVYTSNADELKTIDNLKDGFIFKTCGGTKSKYVYDEPHTEIINGHETELASACIITPTTKTLNETIIPNPFDFAEWDTE